MAQGDRGTLGLIDCATPDRTFGGIQNWRLSTGMNRIVEASGGQVDPTFTSIMDLRPSIGFTTLQISALASFGIAGAQITNLDAYIQKLVKYGTRGGALAHTKVNIGTGMCVPRSLSVAQGGRAELAMDAIALSTDGAAAAVTVTVDQSLPAGGTVGEEFTMGPVKINGTEIDCESVNVDFGLQLQIDASGGQVFPTYACIISRQPVIRCTSKDFDTINTLYAAGAFGVAQGATDSVIYLRKMDKGGTRKGNAVAEHIKLTIDDGIIAIDEAAMTHGDQSAVEFTIQPIYDGSNAILVVSTTSAIV